MGDWGFCRSTRHERERLVRDLSTGERVKKQCGDRKELEHARGLGGIWHRFVLAGRDAPGWGLL